MPITAQQRPALEEVATKPKLLQYIIDQANSANEFHIANADSLLKEGNTLLSLCLSGAAGAFAYAYKLSTDGHAALSISMGCASVWLFAVAAMVTWKCLWARPIMGGTNEPKNILSCGYTVDEVKAGGLPNRQIAIEHNIERNDAVGLWLNRLRMAAAAAPIVALILLGLAHVLVPNHGHAAASVRVRAPASALDV